MEPTVHKYMRLSADGIKLMEQYPITPASNVYYHCIMTDKQRQIIESTMRKIGIKFSAEESPLMFQLCRRRHESQYKALVREQVEHKHTKTLREVEKMALVDLQTGCRVKLAELRERNSNGLSTDGNYQLLYKETLKDLLKTIEGVIKRTEEIQDNYFEKLQSQATVEAKRGRPQNVSYSSLIQVAKPQKSVAPQLEEGSISASDLLGDEEQEPECSMNIFEEKKDEAIKLIDPLTYRRKELGEAITSSVKESFREELKRIVAESNEKTKCIDEEIKPPKLEAEHNLSSESPPSTSQVIFTNQITDQNFRKRSRILVGSELSPTVKYRIYSPGEVFSTVSKVTKHMDTIGGVAVNIRPTSSTALPDDLKDKFIADGLSQVGSSTIAPVQRVNSVVFRKDYKKPPLPLPADDGTHVLCHLCNGRIMCTRLSNLTNHVRRHSAVKQYKCPHCDYQHNEQAKVRMHLNNTHNDTTSLPLDNLTEDMQKIWTYLMERCFPGYLKQLEQTIPNSKIDWERQATKKQENSKTILDTLHNCMECGKAIAINPTHKHMMITEPLADHILENHLEMCCPAKCAQCGYVNSDEWKVRWHISCRHPEQAAEIEVKQGEKGSCMDGFLYKFFPSITNVIGPHNDDPDEIELNKAMLCPETNLDCLSSSATATCIIKEEERKLGEDELDQLLVKNFESDGMEALTQERIRSLLGGDQILCNLCNKVLEWTNKNALTPLLAHAKRHFKIKQFECTQCSYASSESAHVKNHLLQKHNSLSRPKEHNNEAMQNNWLHVMRKCFPELKSRIDHFKFKSHRQYKPEESRENSRRTPPSHGYGTRRKTNFTSSSI